MATLVRDGGSHPGWNPAVLAQVQQAGGAAWQVGLGLEVEGCALGWARLVGRGLSSSPCQRGAPRGAGAGSCLPVLRIEQCRRCRASPPACRCSGRDRGSPGRPAPLLQGLQTLGVLCWGSSPARPVSAPPGAQLGPASPMPAPGARARGRDVGGCSSPRGRGQEPGVWGRLPVGLHCSIAAVLSLSLLPLQERGGLYGPSVPTTLGTGWGALVVPCALPTAPPLSESGGSTGSGSCSQS